MPEEHKRRWFSILENNYGFAGPKKDPEEEPEEPEIEDEDEKEEEGGLEIDLDEEDDEEDDEEIDLDEEDDEEGGKKKSKQNKKFAQMRVDLKKKDDEIEKLKRSQQAGPAAPHKPAAEPQGPAANPKDPRNWTEEQWDAYAKKDWKGAVDLRSQINAENVVQQQTQTNKDNDTLSISKKEVSAKHPELNDDNSEKTKIYLKILDENPRYLTDPKGPIHAMRDMEDRMRELGYPEDEIVAAEKRGAKREQTRQSTVNLTSQKGRHTSDSGRKVQLSKNDLEFCKHNDIDPKEFAKNKHKLSKSKGGLQV